MNNVSYDIAFSSFYKVKIAEIFFAEKILSTSGAKNKEKMCNFLLETF